MLSHTPIKTTKLDAEKWNLALLKFKDGADFYGEERIAV